MSEKNKLEKALTGAEASAEAMRQINPDVVAMYPITPQTPIIQTFAKMVADGLVDTELIRVESEHSAMSATMGASAAGSRAMTATASVGLALMFEVVNAAAGMRLPITMSIANRALSSPINIHCDHSDSMACRDAGWIQIYSETGQEVYENTLLAVRLAEHPQVQLPAMVMQDGFVTSHCLTKVKLCNDEVVKNFIGEFKPQLKLLDLNKPICIGPLELFDYFFETKKQQVDAMKTAKSEYLNVGKELSKITGNEYKYFEAYNIEDADAIIVVLSSTAGTVKEVVDEMRKDGKKVGLLKPILFRPFPYEEVAMVLHNAKEIAVLDRSESFGANGPLYGEIKNALYDSQSRPRVQSLIYGLGGREIFKTDIKKIFDQILDGKEITEKYIGCR